MLKRSPVTLAAILALAFSLFLPLVPAWSIAGSRCSTLEAIKIVAKKHYTCRTVDGVKTWTPTLPPNFGKMYNNNIQVGTPCPRLGNLYWEGMARVECVLVKGKLVYQIKKYPKMSKEVKKVDSLFKKLAVIDDIDLEKYKEVIVVEPGYEKILWTKDSIGGIDSAIKLLYSLGAEPIRPIPFLIFWNFNYAKPKLPSYCAAWANSGGGGVCGTELIFVNLGWFARSGNHHKNDPNSYQDDTQRRLLIGNMQHEVGHYGQTSEFLRLQGITNGGLNPDQDLRPAWLREGAVEFFKMLAYAYQFKLQYSEARNIWIHNNGNRCTSISLKDLLEPKTYQEHLCEYNNGLLAVELLVAKTGDLESIFRMDSQIGENSGMTQAQAFESVFGLDFESFLKEGDKYIRQETA
jgi:hypothetical protein